MTKIAIFNIRNQEIEYIEQIKVCYSYSKISSILELITNKYNAIRLDALRDYIIGQEELKEIFMLIDNMYEELLVENINLKGKLKSND